MWGPTQGYYPWSTRGQSDPTHVSIVFLPCTTRRRGVGVDRIAGIFATRPSKKREESTTAAEGVCSPSLPHDIHNSLSNTPSADPPARRTVAADAPHR